MKKATIVFITILVETGFLWFISDIISWQFVDIIFIGGIIIFGIVWFFQLDKNQNSNVFNANRKGWNGEGEAEVKPFEFELSSVSLGLLLFIVISLLVTVVTYFPYFIAG